MPRCRPFKLIDAMIVVGCSAIGMGYLRPLWNNVQKVRVASPNGVSWQYYARTTQIALSMAILMLIIAYVWIRLVPPSLPRPDLFRQPGMLFLGLLLVLSALLVPLSAIVSLAAPTTLIFAIVLGLSWLMACHHYRSRAEPGWIEGLGRALGVGMLIAIATT